MPTPRRPNLPAALADLGFAIGAGVMGALHGGWILLGGLIVLHLAAWGLLRRAGLRAMPPDALLRTVAISAALIGGVDAIAFLIGSVFN
jgi:hypothetical protein